MITVVVVLHLFIALAMIGLILLQKTEGNSAGGGLSASPNINSMMQPRARANPLSRATVFLGIAFFATSLGLALMAKRTGPAPSIFAAPEAASSTSGPAPRVDELRNVPTDGPTPPVGGTPAPNFNGPAAPAASPATPAAPPAVPQGGAPAVPNN